MGTVTCIVNRYNDELQLLIRDFDEISMTDTRCAGLLVTKDFDDEIVTSGGWTTFVVLGPHDWETNTAGSSTPYGQITNWNGTDNDPSESWLISPEFNNSAGLGSLAFRNACNYSGDALELVVSTDYSGTGDPNLATWTSLTSLATWSSGGWAWVNTEVSLAPYNGANIYIAFKYTGSASSGKTWEIDDIVIKG
jgi:hypothetical protein